MNNETKNVVLIVDDSQENLSVLFDYLQEANFKVLVAERGESAIKRAKHTKPDIILLDVLMPGIDGFETCRQLKNNPHTQDIPVIFISALTDTVDKVKGFEAGGVDYVTKPFQQEEVLARLNTHLTICSLQQEVQTKNDQLQTQNEQLLQLNHEKNEFLNLLAYELKNPFSVIHTIAELITCEFETLSQKEVLEMMDMVAFTSKQMFELINNLLDVNAIESGKREILLELFDILPTVQSLIFCYKNQAQTKNITIHFQPQENQYPALVDNNALYQVLDNLLSNAIKYSPHGKPVIIRLIQKAEAVRCEIQDEGVGLSQSEQQQLFNKFARLTPKPTGQESSNGLGLFIVKKLVEAMNGKVWCESELGQGTTFIVEFPSTPQ